MTTSERARWLVGGVLAAWAIGLVVGAVQLHAWQHEMARVLAQVQADALVRGGSRDAWPAVQPLWHRQRALDLMAAVERLHAVGTWRWVMPGSWPLFDDLEARAMKRLGRAFGDGVVQALRRELERQQPVVPDQSEVQRLQSCQRGAAHRLAQSLRHRIEARIQRVLRGLEPGEAA